MAANHLRIRETDNYGPVPVGYNYLVAGVFFLINFRVTPGVGTGLPIERNQWSPLVDVWEHNTASWIYFTRQRIFSSIAESNSGYLSR